MTFSLLELVAVLAMMGLAVALVYFVKTTNQVRRTAAELEVTARRVSELTPGIQRLLSHGESELEELRLLTQRTSQVAGHVEAVTGEASAATVQLIRGLEGQVANRYGAVVAGARAGLALLKRVRGNGSNGASWDAHDTANAERMEGHE
jgi:dTDP-glucose pyrophosphorylase